MRLPTSFVVLPQQAAGQTLLDFLSQRFAHVPRSEWQARFAEGLVQDASGKALAADALCLPQQRVYYNRRVQVEPPIPVHERVLFEDEAIVIADKPHFLPVLPSGSYVRETLLYRLREKLACPSLSPAHRIDRDTAGLVLFTKRPQDRAAYQNLFRDRLVAKTYEAIAPALDVMALGIEAHLPAFAGLDAAQRWVLLLGAGVEMRSLLRNSAAHFMQMDCQAVPVGQGSNAQTAIRIIAAQADFSALNAENMLRNALPGTWCRYELRPRTGQRHQLRAQMCALGVPIVGDGIYPELTPQAELAHSQAPLQLLARELQFIDPLTGEIRHFTSALALALALNEA